MSAPASGARAETYRHPSLRGVNDVVDAWTWLGDHPAFRSKGTLGQSIFELCVCIDPHRVDPRTGRIEDDARRNTAVHYWVECGPAPTTWPGTLIHDARLDCGGASYEEAVMALYKKVRRVYGGYRECGDCHGTGRRLERSAQKKIKVPLRSRSCRRCRGSGYTRGTYPAEAKGLGGKDGFIGPLPATAAVLYMPKSPRRKTRKNSP